MVCGMSSTISLDQGNGWSITSISGVFGVAYGFTIAYTIYSVVYNLYFHPLSKYPGPTLAAATRLWWVAAQLRGVWPMRVKQLHDQYGDVVRVAPNELAYIDPRALKDIYGFRYGVPENGKDPADQVTPAPTIVSADREWHGQLRKLLSNAFSEKVLKEQEKVLAEYIDLLFTRLHEQCDKAVKSVVISDWYNFTTFDIMARLTFDESFGCLENSAYHPWVKIVFGSVFTTTWIRVMNRIPYGIYLAFILLPRKIQADFASHMQITTDKIQSRKQRKPEYTDFMTHLLRAEESGMLGMPDLVANGATIVVAGSETIASLLAAASYYLLTNAHTYSRVQREVRETFSKEEDINFNRVSQLKYMIACLDETLRMYPPAPAGIVRKTPPEGTVIMGEVIPGNTVIGITPLAAHTCAANFKNPDTFAPERWLGDECFASDKKDALQPFSYGPRNCIGRQLAFLESRLILARMLWNFDMELCEESRSWRKQDVYTLWRKPPLVVRLTAAKR